VSRSEQKIERAARQTRALQLRAEGVEYREIARQLGYASPSGAYMSVQRALQKTVQEPADAVRHLELGRLDQLLSALWDKAIAGDVRAVDRVLAIMARRSALLGLDQPRRIDLTRRLREAAEREGLDPDAAVEEAARIIQELERGGY
jgi:hypothetical protein